MRCYLVNLRPSGPDPGNIKQHGRVLPKRPLFDIKDEPDSAEIQILRALSLDSHRLHNVGGVGSVLTGAFGGEVVDAGDCGGVLGAAEKVGEEGVVV